MLQSKISYVKGETMINYGLRMDKEVYDIIYTSFPDKKQADGIVSTFEILFNKMDKDTREFIIDRKKEIVNEVKVQLLEEFATKNDLKDLELRLEKRIYELKDEIKNVKTELKQDIAEVKTELKQDINKLDTKIDSVKNELDTKIDSVKTELKTDIREILAKGLDEKIKAFKFSIICWIFGGLAIAVSIIKFL